MLNADIGPLFDEAVDASRDGIKPGRDHHVCEHRNSTSEMVVATAESSVGDIES